MTAACRTSKGADCLFLRRHERIVRLVIITNAGWNELNVSLFGTTDVSDCELREFDASLSILFDDVTSNIGVALATLDNDSVVAACSDDVLPDFGGAELRAVGARYFDSVFVAALNFILDDVRLIVVNFDSHFVQVELVADDLSKTVGQERVDR